MPIFKTCSNNVIFIGVLYFDLKLLDEFFFFLKNARFCRVCVIKLSKFSNDTIRA